MSLTDLILLAGQAIAAIIKSVSEASDGKVTPEQAAENIRNVTATMARFKAEDAAADVLEAQKFSTEDDVE